MKKLVILFILSVLPHSGHAAAINSVCPNCYKCVGSVNDNVCSECEYDEAFCLELACPTGKVLQNGECVCENMCVGEQDPDTCECIGGCGFHVACVEGEVFNEETCECEKIKCKPGWYHNGSGCAACPGNTESGDGGYDGSSSLMVFCGYSSSSFGANGITDCYQVPATRFSLDGSGACQYSDVSGNYQLTNDCPYSL